MIRFSVILCTYNRDKYISAALESIAKQDFSCQNYELIMVDNNSTDNTENVCKDFINKYPHIDSIYYKELNQGISYARNKGIELAKGEYIVFIDDDETIDTFYLSKLDEYLTDLPQALLAGTPVFPVYETEKPKWLSHFTMRLITGYYYKGNKVKLLKAKDYPGTGHAIIRKELFDRFGNFSTELGRKGTSLLGAEDKDMFLRLIDNNIDCYYFPGIPIYHHIPDSKLTDSFFRRLTYSVGQSERIRTKNISDKTYYKRVFSECIKWGASILLFVFYTIRLAPTKGWKLLQFRWNVSKGLLGK